MRVGASVLKTCLHFGSVLVLSTFAYKFNQICVSLCECIYNTYNNNDNNHNSNNSNNNKDDTNDNKERQT